MKSILYGIIMMMRMWETYVGEFPYNYFVFIFRARAVCGHIVVLGDSAVTAPE